VIHASVTSVSIVSVAKSIENISRLLASERHEAHPCSETETWLLK
uniref:Uncharacterized protein n=1 Tax=Caenorhabditis japonica TaxID=281687 RepID=A0A8R1IPK8_CAEJA